MERTHLALLLFCTWLSSFSSPPPALAVDKKLSALPAEVRTYLPTGATSFFAMRLPIGYQGTMRFVHIWGAVRPNTADSLNSYNRYTYSPFCVDIFEPIHHGKNRWAWRFVSASTYTDVAGPNKVIPHWLQPTTKQGAVLEIISNNGAPGLSTTHTLLVWDKGLQQGDVPPVPQMFASGASGGGVVQQVVGSMDKRGYLTVTTKNYYVGKLLSTVVHGWDGERFATPPLPK